METLRLLGEWLIAPLTDIKVLDFQCWRRNSAARRRTFDPYIHLKVGKHDVIIDGYKDVWSFLDTIQPSMYRSMVNAAMKGDVEDVIFANDLENLIQESEIDMLTIQYEGQDYFKVPNSIRSLKCYLAKDFRDTAIQKTDDKYLRHDFIVKIDTPHREVNGDINFYPTLIYGYYPQLVLVTETQHGASVSTVIYNAEGADFRPHSVKTLRNEEIGRYLRETLPSTLHLIGEKTFVCLSTDNKDVPSMQTRERIDIEASRKSFFLE